MGEIFGKTGVAEPAFDVLLRCPKGQNGQVPFEVRQYSRRFAIETPCERDGQAFMELARFIGVGSKPQNDGVQAFSMTAPVVKRGEAISMTAPVVKKGDANVRGACKMSFILPAKYDSMSKIPKPTSSRVKVVEVPPAKGAVLKFNGWVSDSKSEAKWAQLLDSLKSKGVDAEQQPHELWQFHPPFTIPFLRRNEIWVGLTPKQVKTLASNCMQPEVARQLLFEEVNGQVTSKSFALEPSGFRDEIFITTPLFAACFILALIILKKFRRLHQPLQGLY